MATWTILSDSRRSFVIIDLQAKFTKLHSHTASVGVDAPGEAFRTSYDLIDGHLHLSGAECASSFLCVQAHCMLFHSS